MRRRRLGDIIFGGETAPPSGDECHNGAKRSPDTRNILLQGLSRAAKLLSITAVFGSLSWCILVVPVQESSLVLHQITLRKTLMTSLITQHLSFFILRVV